MLASDVIALANQFYSSNALTASDSHTIKLTVTRGVSYIPIPTGAGENFAGLFTVDLPSTVTAGQEFNIVVRRISTRTIQPPPPPPHINAPIQTHTLPSTIGEVSKKAKAKEAPAEALAPVTPGAISWRYVVGTFQVQIPVTTKDKMLSSEEDTLAIMKWRLQQMMPSNRWYSVLERYNSYIAARVDGLGGDADDIAPSFDGAPRDTPICIRIRVLNSLHQPRGGTVNIEFQPQDAGEIVKVKAADASKDIDVLGLRRYPQVPLYEVTVTPTNVFKPTSQFVKIPPSGFDTVEFVIG